MLAPGGRICCVVGDVCLPRRKAGRHYIMPLHADIQVRARRLGLDALSPIYWNKIANGVTEASGNGAGFYGKPYQPGAVVKNDVEFILFLRKGGEYRKPTMLCGPANQNGRPLRGPWNWSMLRTLRTNWLALTYVALVVSGVTAVVAGALSAQASTRRRPPGTLFR